MTTKSITFVKMKKGWKIYKRISGDNSYSYLLKKGTKQYFASSLANVDKIIKTGKQPAKQKFRTMRK